MFKLFKSIKAIFIQEMCVCGGGGGVSGVCESQLLRVAVVCLRTVKVVGHKGIGLESIM